MGKAIDMTGKICNKIHVISRAPNKGEDVCWFGWCDCQKNLPPEERQIKIYRGKQLRNGSVKSCGCLRQEIMNKKFQNKRFGKLIATKPIKLGKDHHMIWECQCDCGNICYVSTKHLTDGNTKSCGCLKSKGEEKIQKILIDNKIEYQKEKTFENCKYLDTDQLARFDFFIENKYIIEYDGIQHFEYREIGWNNKENFQKVQNHDTFKNQWCKENNIPIIRIPYTHLDKICLEDLKLETSKFII
jgi:hypothetical protein